jgi:aspartyl-tRNA(Asn)/glutamyl-tRNA(Gln) amidotransferase subunit B
MGSNVEFEAVIGIECHAQLLTRSKIFSSAATDFGAPANSETDPIVLGMPGVLPVLNRHAVELALRMAIATGCEIRRRSRFARKHYFYPDLPKGYQISQYDEPIAEHGGVDVEVDGKQSRVRLTRIHMEEDAGKNIHVPGRHTSLVDFNRAGVPLIEIVSEPDLRSAAEAGEYMRALRQMVVWLGVSDGNMEEGSLRCDANVSIRPRGEQKLGTKTELKNINSFKFVEKAIAHEIARQEEIVRGGGRVVQETRLWDSERQTSRSMRSKEQAHDYRYFPEPDLPPLVISDEWIEKVRQELPELPRARTRRFVDKLGLSQYDAAVLTAERDLADYFEEAVRAYGAGGDHVAKRVSSFMQTEVMRELNRANLPAARAPVTGARLAELLKLVDDGTISGKIAKDVFDKMWKTSGSASDIVKAEGLTQVSDTGAIEAACRKAVESNPRQAEQFRAGKESLLGFFVGQVMKETQGKANPALVNETLRRLLKGG